MVTAETFKHFKGVCWSITLVTLTNMEPWQGVKVPYVLFKSTVQQTLISRIINASAPVQEEPKGNSITQ